MSNEPSLGLIYSAILEVKGEVGGLKQAVGNNTSHIEAVSDKASLIRKELQDHADKDEAHALDMEAHGIGSDTKLLAKMGGMVVGAVALVEGVVKLGPLLFR